VQGLQCEALSAIICTFVLVKQVKRKLQVLQCETLLVIICTFVLVKQVKGANAWRLAQVCCRCCGVMRSSSASTYVSSYYYACALILVLQMLQCDALLLRTAHI
jgi:hypothetical protein